jgi:hypothetical protein
MATKKPPYTHADVLTTAKNLLAIMRQEALLHPYLKIRASSKEAVPVLEELIPKISDPKMTKNQVLNTIAHHRAMTAGGLAVLSVLRTPIVSNALDREDDTRDLKTIRTLCEASLSAGTDEESTAQMQWVLRAVDHVSETLDRLHWPALHALAPIASQYRALPPL